MKHQPEFSKPVSMGTAQQTAKELAACYARVFLGSDDGKRVLADLRQKFGLHRLVFARAEGGQIDIHAGLLIDGERRVLSEIEEALRLGVPQQILPP